MRSSSKSTAAVSIAIHRNEISFGENRKKKSFRGDRKVCEVVFINNTIIATNI